MKPIIIVVLVVLAAMFFLRPRGAQEVNDGVTNHTYSTVSQREMNEAVAAVIDLAGYREAMGR